MVMARLGHSQTLSDLASSVVRGLLSSQAGISFIRDPLVAVSHLHAGLIYMSLDKYPAPYFLDRWPMLTDYAAPHLFEHRPVCGSTRHHGRQRLRNSPAGS